MKTASCILAVLLAVVAYGQAGYNVTTIPSQLLVSGLSDTGLVCGYYFDDSLNWYVGIVWDSSNNAIYNLGANAIPSCISGNGKIAGLIEIGPVEPPELPPVPHLFVTDESGLPHDTGIIATEVDGINNSGQVLYSNYINDRYSNCIYDSATGTIQPIPEFQPYGINKNGEVAGSHYFWSPVDGLISILGDNPLVWAHALNDSGTVVGYWRGGGYRAFMWSQSAGFTDLGTLGYICRAFSINNSGTIIGSSEMPNYASHAWIYNSDTGMVDLNSFLTSNCEWQCLQDGCFINEKGQIIGWGIKTDGSSGYFLMTPIPEPMLGLMKITPQTINRKSNQPRIRVVIQLPDDGQEDIDLDELLVISCINCSGKIKAVKQSLSVGNSICAEFDKEALMAAVPNGDIELKVVGKLVSGQSFYGTDTVKIIH
jgi:probable HAF family extracellular repeat protein